MRVDLSPGILDEFSASQPLTSAQEPVVVAQSVPEASGNDADVFPSDVFSKDLQEQMTALMGGMEGLSANNDQPRTSTSHQQPPRTERDFQESIRKTMERMQASDSQAASGTEDESVDDLLAQVLKEIGNGDPAGGEDEDGLNKMLLGMMEQLTNKEVLYDPMKEMQEKFPAWMEKNRLTSRPADMKRYEDQQRIVGDILARFDRKQYSDANTEDRDFIVERMQQVRVSMHQSVNVLIYRRCKLREVLPPISSEV